VKAPAPASDSVASAVPLADGLRIYAVGDLHGRLDLLESMAGLIRADMAERPPERSVEIFLGDYVDRGPQSRGVIDWMLDTPPLTDQRICMMGNHEDMLLAALAGPDGVANWLHNGGDAALASYGLNVRPFAGNKDAVRISEDIRDVLPKRHQAFAASLPRMVDFSPYLFVHAGIRPGVPLDAQDQQDLIWIREPFLVSDAEFGRIVVHGHTPVEAPDVRSNRINIDTGAYYSGLLTCLALEGASRRFIQAGPV
jgi:serine/threonine protein phosphatase 1